MTGRIRRFRNTCGQSLPERYTVGRALQQCKLRKRRGQIQGVYLVKVFIIEEEILDWGAGDSLSQDEEKLAGN